MKPFLDIFTDKSPIDILKAGDAIVNLYKVHGLGRPEIIFKHNLLECVEHVRKTGLFKTSVKAEIVKDLSAGESTDFDRGNGWKFRTEQNIYKFVLGRLLLKTPVCVFPQINRAGYDYLWQKLQYTNPAMRLGSFARLKWEAWESIYNNVSFFIPLAEHCIISSTRFQVYATKSPQSWSDILFYHRDGGLPAIHAEGTEIFNQYYLHNVHMPSRWFKKRAEELNPSEILAIPNVEQRMELIRYVGMDRMLAKLPHKVISVKKPYYELLVIRLDTSRRRPAKPRVMVDSDWQDDNLFDAFGNSFINCIYLKMINPSTGTFHVEAVAPTCTTVQMALDWRAQNIINDDGFESWEPSQIT